jgi:RNA polymerase sigma-70 factor (ECF subfamily)
MMFLRTYGISMNLGRSGDVNMNRAGEQIGSADPTTDEELLTRLKAGQMDQFGLLVRRYERELYGYLRRYLGDDSLAEDVFQNTFLQIFQKIDQYEDGRPVRPWLYTIATHQAIDALRRAGRRPVVSLDEARKADPNGETHSLRELVEARTSDPFEHLEREERRERVRAGVAALPDHLRSTLLLAYYQGMKYREIAEVLDIPVGTVKSRLHAAIAKLQEAWQQHSSLREEV